MNIKPNPCKCGGKPDTYISDKITMVCNKCGVSVTGKTKSEALKAWNKKQEDKP